MNELMESCEKGKLLLGGLVLPPLSPVFAPGTCHPSASPSSQSSMQAWLRGSLVLEEPASWTTPKINLFR